MNTITYTNGSTGTMTWEQGKHGGAVLVLRRGYPVAAEVVGGLKGEHASPAMLAALGVVLTDDVVEALA